MPRKLSFKTTESIVNSVEASLELLKDDHVLDLFPDNRTRQKQSGRQEAWPRVNTSNMVILGQEQADRTLMGGPS